MRLVVSFGTSSSSDRQLRGGVRIRYGLPKLRGLKLRRLRRSLLTVTVLTTIGAHQAALTSVMLYGACLHGGRRLRRREIIAICLPSGSRIKARVCWRLGQRSGVKFLSPIADFARLISEGAVITPPLRARLRNAKPPLSWIEGPRAVASGGPPSTPDGFAFLRRVALTAHVVGDWLFGRPRTAENARVCERVVRPRAIDDIGFLPPLP